VTEYFTQTDAQFFWIAIGFALVLAEVLMGNFILFFLGIASIFTGVALWLGMPADNGLPFLLFATLAVALLVGLRSKLRSVTVGDVASSSIDEDFVGRDVQIESGFDAASPGRGRVSYRGASWDARSEQEHLQAGSFAVILSRESSLLFIGTAKD
jgi:membrane protein implicated in regulation of membrane protease activity